MIHKVNSQDACVICGGVEYTTLYPARDRLHGIPGEFKLDECVSCGLITVHPRLSRKDSEKYYPSDYISFPLAIEDEKSWIRRVDRKYGLEKRCQAIIKRTNSPGRILDIGCATGIFLSGMKKHGWECYGIEPSGYAANYANKRFQINIFHGYLEESNFPAAFFDVITLWDVLEHLQDPVASLEHIHRLLKPGGMLVASLPNANAWERTWFGENWIGWDVPRHYNIFTPKTINLLLSKCNFETKEITSFTGRHGALVLSVGFLLSDKNISPRNTQIILTILRSFLARAVTYPFYALADALNKSSIMCVFAKTKSV